MISSFIGPWHYSKKQISAKIFPEFLVNLPPEDDAREENNCQKKRLNFQFVFYYLFSFVVTHWKTPTPDAHFWKEQNQKNAKR